MFVDQTSLLLALGFAAFALSTTLFVTWVAARTEWFILIWATGAAILVAAFAGFSIYAVTSVYGLLWLSNMLLTGGFVLFFSAAALFSEGRFPRVRAACLAIASALGITAPFLFGLDALGAMTGNLANALILGATAWKFWQGKDEAPLWVIGIVLLYSLTALSFVPCAIVIYSKGPLVLLAPPSGWAEDLNSIMGLVGLTGIGALSLALNQARVARKHRQEANTDPLTGLLNRRAIFDQFGAAPIGNSKLALIFDLDHFKAINDKHGHAAGDEALRRFAQVIRQHAPHNALAARIGGEEFLLVLPGRSIDEGLAIAEAIRSGFACEILQGSRSAFRSTVSAGLAAGERPADTLDDVLRRADEALYAAKTGGRNRVSLPSAGSQF